MNSYISTFEKKYREKGGALPLLQSAVLYGYRTRIRPTVRYLYTLDLLASRDRTIPEIRCLIDNKRDRHDALLAPQTSPTSYTRQLGRQNHIGRYLFAASLLRDSMPDFPNTHLDVACGTGYGTLLLSSPAARADSRIVGSDIEPDALSYASRTYPDAEYARATGTSLPFGTDTFDSATSIETIEHVPDPNAFLEGLSRVVSSDGSLVLSVPNNEDIDFEQQRADKDYPHLSSFTISEFEDIIHTAFPDASVTFYGHNHGLDVIEFSDSELRSLSWDERQPIGFYEISGRDTETLSGADTLFAHVVRD